MFNVFIATLVVLVSILFIQIQARKPQMLSIVVVHFWTNGNDIISRFKAMKKNMAAWNAQYDQSMTEAENMHQLKYYRYFDAGNQRYVLK